MRNDAAPTSGGKREPFCWLEKQKLRTIADVWEEGKHGNLAAARSVYLALGEIASDKQSATFTVAISYIAQRAAVTSKTVRRVIGILKKLGFLKAQARSANGLKLAYEYTLTRGHRAIGLSYPSFGKARKNAFPTREECNEESTERTARKEKEILSGNDDIITHARTGERFNQRTKEFDW
jgi:hypothetical protein